MGRSDACLYNHGCMDTFCAGTHLFVDKKQQSYELHSIVVNVLQAIFNQVVEIQKLFI